VVNSDLDTIVETYGVELTANLTYTVSGQLTGPGEGGPITLTVVNELGVPVCYLFVSPSTSTEWGPDWLGATEVIQPGASRGFAVPAGVLYDFRADDCDHNMLQDEYQILISDLGFSWTVGP
jgi:hypothetical protein